MSPRLVDNELWELIEPLLPPRTRRYRYPGRKRIDDRKVLTGILFVLTTGIPWQPAARARLRLRHDLLATSAEWHQAGVWQLHELLLRELNQVELDVSRAVSTPPRCARLGATRRGRAPSTGSRPAPSTT